MSWSRSRRCPSSCTSSACTSTSWPSSVQTSSVEIMFFSSPPPSATARNFFCQCFCKMIFSNVWLPLLHHQEMKFILVFPLEFNMEIVPLLIFVSLRQRSVVPTYAFEEQVSRKPSCHSSRGVSYAVPSFVPRPILPRDPQIHVRPYPFLNLRCRSLENIEGTSTTLRIALSRLSTNSCILCMHLCHYNAPPNDLA